MARAPATTGTRVRVGARRTLRDEIRTLLTARIVDGTYGPGERIVEMQIARELGVSQAPVREAIRELESLRLVTHEPYRGARVRAPNLDELRAVVPVREALEILAIRLGIATLAADPGPLRACYASMQEAAAEGDRHAFAVNDSEFHATLVDAAGNSVLRDAWEALGADRHVFMTASRLELDLNELCEFHGPLLAACERGDVEAAVAELKVHLRRFAMASSPDDVED